MGRWWGPSKNGFSKGYPPAGVSTLLQHIALSSGSVLETAAPGTIIGALLGTTAGVVPVLSDNAGNKVALSGNNLVVGAAGPLDRETIGASFNIQFTQTDAGFTNSPLVTNIAISITNVFEVGLNALGGTFSLAETAAAGTTAGALTGTSSGSTLSLLNDAGGRVALSGTNIVRGGTQLDYEQATSHSFTVRETHPDGSNSPRDTVLTLTVTNAAEAPTSFTFSDVGTSGVSTLWTSNAIVVAGLAAGDSAAYSLTGDASRSLIKNGAAAPNAGTVVNGDTLAISLTSSASNGVTVNATLTIGTTSDTFSVTTPAVSGGTLSTYTPTITKVSAAGAAPFDYKYTGLDFSIVAAGDFLEIDVGTDITSPAVDANGYFVDRAYTPIVYQLTESDVTSAVEDPAGTLSINLIGAGFTTISGDMAVHSRVIRDDGTASNWSNTLVDTISAATTTWTTTNGVDKNASITASGTPALTATGAAGRGIYQYIRATASTAETKWWIEFTIVAIGGGIRIGLDNGTLDFGTYSGFASGVSDNNGWYFNLGANTDYWTNSGSAPSASVAGTNWVNGSVGMIEVDETTKTIRIYKNGTLVQTVTYTATTLAAGKMLTGMPNAESITINFGQSAPSSRTPTAGYNAHG